MAALMLAGLGVGIAGGVLGGMQQASQQEAQYLAQKIQVERNNFKNNLANDKQTMMIAKANVNRQFQNAALEEAAYTNQYLSMRALNENTQESYLQASMNAAAAQATLQSQVTGKLGNASGGTAQALKRQAKAAERRKLSQISEAQRLSEKKIETDYKNTLAQRDMLTYDQASVYIPGSTGVRPDSSGAMLSGILGGLGSGLQLAGGLDTLATNLGGSGA